jgi:phosphatidate cytidylyltransferase
VIVLTGAIFLGPYTFALLFLILTVLSMREFFKLTEVTGNTPQKIPGMISGVILFILSFLIASGSFGEKLFFLLIPIFFFIPVYELFRKKENPVTNIALTMMGVLYVAVPFSMLNFFVFEENSYHYTLLISIFIFIWSGDSGAYIFGSKFGRRKLFERISPKKSWEGSLGGLFTAILAAWILSLVFKQYSLSELIILAVITVISGTLGDLVESMIKRSVGVKDSGHFMPGHGGLLDRFDSLLLASPMIFFVLQFLPS